MDVPVSIPGPLDMKRRCDDELMAMLEPPVERRHDRGAGIARDPHWAGRKSRLLAEEGHRPAILEEIAISQDPHQFAPLESRQHPAQPTRRHLFKAGAPTLAEIGHAGVDELRYRTGH